MKLRERIKKNSNYIQSVEMTGGLNIVKVVLPEKWMAYESENGLIKVARPDNPYEVGVWFYYCNENEAEVDDIIDLLEETVEMNENVILKVKLLSEKVEELKNVFENEPLAKLQTLKFVMKEPKTKKSSSVAPKKTGRPKKTKKSESNAVLAEKSEQKTEE